MAELGDVALIRRAGCGQEKVEGGERYRCVSHKTGDQGWGILPGGVLNA